MYVGIVVRNSENPENTDQTDIVALIITFLWYIIKKKRKRGLIMDERTKTIVNRVNSRIFKVPKGMLILQEGEVNLDMYKILAGHAEVYAGYQTPQETLIRILGPGECFGEYGLLLQKPAIYTVVAYSEATLFRIVEGELGDFVQQNHKNIIDIMKNMAKTMMTMRCQMDLLINDLEHKKKPNKDLLKKAKKSLDYSALPNNDISARLRFLDNSN